MLDKEAWIREFKDKNILIWGYGMEGKSSYRFIRSLLPEQTITIADKKKDAITDTVNTILLDESETNFNEYDLILKAPGIVVSEDIDKTKITGQAPLFLKHYKKQTIGITGTKGKSTTSSLIASVLKTKYTTFLVGNIGKACFDIIEDLTEDALIVFEISCHQLEFSTYSPHVAVHINLFDEHLDHYGTLEKYGKAKDQIFKHQNEGDILIIGEAIKDRADRENKLIIGEDIYAVNHTVHAANKEIEIKDCALHGEHNYQNLAVAYEIANLYQVSDENYLEAVKELGLEVGKEATAVVKATSVMIEDEKGLSARNQLAGKVVAINEGPVNAVVKVELASGSVVTSTITVESVKELGLEVGKEATAIVKATSVMIG